MAGHFFISYSRADGEQIALTLGDQLAKGPPPIGVWLDRRRLQPGIDWDKQLVEALRACDGLLFVMTEDSVSDESECKKEWTRALKYKKPIVPLLFDKRAELPCGSSRASTSTSRRAMTQGSRGCASICDGE